MPGPYTIPNVYADVYCVYTNRTPATAMRGFGITGVDFALEVQMDKLAHAVGMDPMEFRILNAYRDGDMKAHRREAKNTRADRMRAGGGREGRAGRCATSIARGIVAARRRRRARRDCRPHGDRRARRVTGIGTGGYARKRGSRRADRQPRRRRRTAAGRRAAAAARRRSRRARAGAAAAVAGAAAAARGTSPPTARTHGATRFSSRVRHEEALTWPSIADAALAAINYPIGMNLGGDPSQALVHSNPDGKFTVALSSIDLGQGMKSVTRQIAAETLGVPVEDVYVDTADTDTGPHCMGSFASRGTHRVGNAVIVAAQEARARDAGSRRRGAGGQRRRPRHRRPGNIHVNGAPSRSITVDGRRHRRAVQAGQDDRRAAASS